MKPAAALAEIYRRDFRRYCEEQVTILPKTGVPCKLALNPLQGIIDDIAVDQWREHGFVRVVVFKARQRGGTTYSIARGTWRAFLNANISAIIISCDDDSTGNAFNKAQLIYENLNPAIKPMRRYLNKTQIVLENPDTKTRPANPGLRSRFECTTAKNINAGVSTTRQVVCMSEMPRWGRTEEIRSSLLPTMPLDAPGTCVINEATPFGWGKGREEFRSWCDAARSGKDVYRFVELYWWMDPECRIPRSKNERLRFTADERYWKRRCNLDDEQILFRRRMIMELGKMDTAVGEMLFLQEFPSDYESAWEATETPAFDQIKLNQLTASTVSEPRHRYEFEVTKSGNDLHAEIVPAANGSLWIWEEPILGELYDIGADCAPPTNNENSDYCAFQVIKRSNKDQVAEWKGHPGIYDFAAMLMAAGYYYNEAHLAIEVNGIGYAVNEAVVLGLYPNIYRWRLRQQATPKFSTLTGWKTQDDTKKLLLGVAYRFFEHDELNIHSKRLREEMRHYVKYYSDAGNEHFEAGSGHDDLLMSWMIAQVISRDEDALGGAPTSAIERPKSLAERNAELEYYLKHHQPGLSDRGAEMAFGPRKGTDPWSRLAAQFGLHGDYDD